MCRAATSCGARWYSVPLCSRFQPRSLAAAPTRRHRRPGPARARLPASINRRHPKAALTGEPDSLDPATSTIYTGAQVYDNIFSKLIDMDTNGRSTASRHRLEADDDTTWVFDLVDDATFHNGEPFTADDVKYTFERILDPKTASAYSPLTRHRERRGRVPDPGHLPPQVALRTVPEQPREQRRDRQPEGDRGGGSRAQPGRHRPLQVRGVGPGRPHHAGEERRTSRTASRISTASSSGSCSWTRAASRRSAPVSWTGSTRCRSPAAAGAVDRPSFTYVTTHRGHPGLPGPEHGPGAIRQPLVRQAVRWRSTGHRSATSPTWAPARSGEEVPSGSPWFDGTQSVTPDVDKAKLLRRRASERPRHRLPGPAAYPELLKTGQVVREQLKASA